MANRLGEFVLVVDPANDAHIVAWSVITQLVDTLEQVIQRGVTLDQPEFSDVELYLAASPEIGSVRMPMIAAVAVTAATALGAAADASQLLGVSVSDVLSAVHRRVYEAAEPPLDDDTIGKIASDRQFGRTVSELLTAARESGYSSVRIEADGFKIELTDRVPSNIAEAIALLETRLERLELQVEELGDPKPYVGNVRPVEPERAQLERQIKGVYDQLYRLRAAQDAGRR